jgi:hypothetical protein
MLQWIDAFRLLLPLDSKRPTVDRRFFCDELKNLGVTTTSKMKRFSSTLNNVADIEAPISSVLESILIQHLTQNDDQNNNHAELSCCRVFRYQRFLEYTMPGSVLAPHSDGTKKCDDTGLTSTHTLLLYLTDCEEGGETLLLHSSAAAVAAIAAPDNNTEIDHNLIHATKPKRGRILLFPHATPHAGAAVVSVPKICLRAEVHISWSQ